MTFPLTLHEQLPAPGAKREDLRLDLKGTVNTQDSFELAKDVAAFANSTGGVILVGAYEGANNTLGKYAPMVEAEAAAVKNAYNLAVRDRCSPAPIHDPVLIPRDGGWVVAVNVWPFPGQPVSNREAARGDPEKAGWVFPMRTGTHPVFLKPEQIPMLVVAEPRRIAVLLDSIPTDRRAGITVVHFVTGTVPHRTSFDLVEVRPLENVAVFRAAQVQAKHFHKIPAASLLHVPLDGISSVWSRAGGDWSVTLKGRIDTINTELMFSPFVPHPPGRS